MKQTAQRVALSTLIVIAIVAVALALWKVKLVLALLFLAFILAAALRPGIERLARAGIPRGFGLLIHYVLLIGVVAFALWMVVPRAIDQVQSALGGTTKAQIHQEATNSTGIKHDILNVLVSVTAVGILFGGFAVVLAVPLVAVLVTVLDVVVRDVDPAEEDVPTVLFPAKDAET
jgi:predicted PurR-regulated permease PerM